MRYEPCPKEDEGSRFSACWKVSRTTGLFFESEQRCDVKKGLSKDDFATNTTRR